MNEDQQVMFPNLHFKDLLVENHLNKFKISYSKIGRSETCVYNTFNAAIENKYFCGKLFHRQHLKNTDV